MKSTDEKVLFVCIIKQSKIVLDKILTGFMENGVSGATIFDGRGMAQIIKNDIPIFSGLSELFPGGDTDSSMILSIIEKGMVEDAVKIVEDAAGSLEKPGTGIVFTLPIDFVYGIKKAH